MSNTTMVKPFVIDLELTSACPADCPMCPRDKLPSVGIMSEKTFTDVLKFVGESEHRLTIILCGIGEPLLHPKIFEYIARLKQLPVKPRVFITTAGERLTPEVFEKLKELGVDLVSLSLQAVEENLYKKLMPGISLDKVLKNIDYISSHQGDKLQFGLNITVHRQNEQHIGKIMDFARSRKLNVKMSGVHNRGGNMLDTGLMEKPMSGTGQVNSCKIFESINFIAWTGDIHPCCQDIERANIIGNVAIDSFDSLAARKTDIVNKQAFNYKICSACNDTHRNSIITEKNLDFKEDDENDKKLFFEMNKRIGIWGENFYSRVVSFNNPDALLEKLDFILADMSRSLNTLHYLRKKYPGLAVEIKAPAIKISKKILAGMNIEPDEHAQLNDISHLLFNRYGLFSEHIFEKIRLMPKQQVITMVYRHFDEARQFLYKDLYLMHYWLQANNEKEISISSTSAPLSALQDLS